MFEQDVTIPGITTTVAKNGANLYAELLAHDEIRALMPATITAEMFEKPIVNKPLKALGESLLVGQKKSVWVKGLYAVALAIQEREEA